jgi:UDP-N-acetylmuramate--alanine ligase
MNFKDIKQVYFLGIGGIGMSAIARYFNTQNIPVMGYDKTETELTKSLVKEGIEVHYKDLGSELANFGFNKNNVLVILTPAIPKNHEEYNWFLQNEFTILKRSQVLGVITDNYKTAGIAGTHGKTTTSALLAHILKQSKVDCAAFLGGISTNYNSNLLLHYKTNNTTTTQNQLMVVEADEFDRSFLTLHPSIGVITSTDADHLDIYGEHDALKKSFTDYAAQVRDVLFIKKELELYSELLHKEHSNRVKSYSITQQADVFADNIKIEGDTYYFDLHNADIHLLKLNLGIPGLHNVENAVAASAVALHAGVSSDELRSALASFKGVKRRFEYLLKNNEQILNDEYAHHPAELAALISGVRSLYSNQKLTLVFQPHLYSRTQDLCDGFAASLSAADEVVLLPIYPARELPIAGVTSEMIAHKMTHKNVVLLEKEALGDWVKKQQPKLLIMAGAGDIDVLIRNIKNDL